MIHDVKIVLWRLVLSNTRRKAPSGNFGKISACYEINNIDCIQSSRTMTRMEPKNQIIQEGLTGRLHVWWYLRSK